MLERERGIGSLHNDYNVPNCSDITEKERERAFAFVTSLLRFLHI